MSDTNLRPSIAELQRAFDRDTFSDEAKLIDAAPVLLEIAATGLAWSAAEDALGVADSATARVAAAMRATAAFDKHRAALAKVRP